MSTNWTSIAKKFIKSPYFAVVGASTSRDKFGNKVFRWYQTYELNVTPVHPKEKVIEGVESVASISELPSPSKTSISVITPPKVTLKVLEEAKKIGIRFIWIQPGAEDENVIKYIQQHFDEPQIVYGGPCILVHGPKLVQERDTSSL